MNDRGDWLWDGSGEPDLETERAARLLARFAHDPDAPLVLPRRRWLEWAVAAGLLAALGVGLWTWPESDGYPVQGAEARVVHGGDRVAADEPTALLIGDLGRLDLEPGARLRVGNDGVTEHAFYLERGVVHAFILAEPRVLSIGTPAGLTVDLGCRYTIDVAEDGTSLLSVQQGRVAFEIAGRSVVVPAGASTRARPGSPPRVPVFDDADPSWVAAVRALENEIQPTFEAIAAVVGAARPIDSLTLFHLAAWAPSADVRTAAHEALRASVPEPPGGSGLSHGDPEARAAWRARLQLDWPF